MTATADASGTPTRASTRPTARVRRGPARNDISRVPYLPGLDGMRAIAVVAVMVYHANPDWLPGGYLGVEVFFVISGYLITLLLISVGAVRRPPRDVGRVAARVGVPDASAVAVM